MADLKFSHSSALNVLLPRLHQLAASLNRCAAPITERGSTEVDPCALVVDNFVGCQAHVMVQVGGGIFHQDRELVHEAAVVNIYLPAPLIRMETMRPYLLGLNQASREISSWQCKCLIQLHFHPDASGIKEASAKVVCKAILEIGDVVFHRHKFTVSGTAVGWPPKAAAHHLHVEYGAEDRPGDEDHVRLWSIEAGSQDAVIADYP